MQAGALYKQLGNYARPRIPESGNPFFFGSMHFDGCVCLSHRVQNTDSTVFPGEINGSIWGSGKRLLFSDIRHHFLQLFLCTGCGAAKRKRP